MPRPGPNVTSDADTQPGSDSLFPTGFSGGGALVRPGSVGTGEIADASIAAADLNLASVATSLAARAEFTGTYVPKPSATAPSNPVAGQMWLSSRYQDLRVSNSKADRRKILTGSLSFESTAVQEPSVWVANSLYNMVYTGGTGTHVLCYASCPTTADPTVAANWTKNGTKVLGGGVGGQAGGVYHGNLYVEGSTLYYYYVDQATNLTIRVATASLSAPTVWTDQGVVMTLPYTAVAFGNTYLLKISGTYYLIFEMSIDNWQMGVATCSTATGTFTAVQSSMYTLTTVASNSFQGGPWAVVEGTNVVLYYHSGPHVSGSIPSEIYRATIPLAQFGTDNWTVADNKTPSLRRVAPEEVDQVADPFVFTNAAGQSYVAWEGFDNSTSKASIFCQPLLPVLKMYDGSVWQTVTPAADAALGINQPGKPSFTELAADTTVTSTSFVTVLSGTFTPSGTKAACAIAGFAALPGSSAITKYQFLQGATAKGAGQVPGAGNQMPVTGIRVFTGLTPGTTYTFEFQVKVASGSWLCRPAAFPDAESLTLKIEDVAYPSSIS